VTAGADSRVFQTQGISGGHLGHFSAVLLCSPTEFIRGQNAIIFTNKNESQTGLGLSAG